VEQCPVRQAGACAYDAGAGKSSLINALRLGRHRPDAEISLGMSGGQASGVDVYGVPPLRIPQSALQGSAPQLGDISQDVSSGDDISEDHSSSSQGASTSKQQQEFLKIGELSRIGRGMHTTTSVSLISLPQGGRLADTPGFSQPTLEAVNSTVSTVPQHVPSPSPCHQLS
jgi:hypothetical protein